MPQTSFRLLKRGTPETPSLIHWSVLRSLPLLVLASTLQPQWLADSAFSRLYVEYLDVAVGFFAFDVEAADDEDFVTDQSRRLPRNPLK